MNNIYLKSCLFLGKKGPNHFQNRTSKLKKIIEIIYNCEYLFFHFTKSNLLIFKFVTGYSLYLNKKIYFNPDYALAIYYKEIVLQ